jgi:hypothetical protein
MTIDIVADIVVLVLVLGFMVYLPFMALHLARLRSGNPKALKYPDGKRWLVVTICAGEIACFSPVVQFVATHFLPRNKPNLLPVPVQCLGPIVLFVGAIGVLWAGIKLARLRYD